MIDISTFNSSYWRCKPTQLIIFSTIHLRKNHHVCWVHHHVSMRSNYKGSHVVHTVDPTDWVVLRSPYFSALSTLKPWKTLLKQRNMVIKPSLSFSADFTHISPTVSPATPSCEVNRRQRLPLRGHALPRVEGFAEGSQGDLVLWV